MEYLVRFSPARPCSDTQCIATTEYGLAERKEDAAFVTYPYCPLHGYLEAMHVTQREDERFTIARFVVWMHHEQGQVTSVEHASSDQLPAKKEWREVWRVAYCEDDSDSKVYFVAWSFDHMEFSLYAENGREIEERIVSHA